MKAVIYCASWEKGEAKFDEIAENLKNREGAKIIKRKRGSFAALPNGDSWEVVYAYDGARGCKWNYCYVDDEISLRIFYDVIRYSKISNAFDRELWQKGVTLF